MTPARALLAALHCAKGDPRHNLRMHEQHLGLAAEQGCDIAVFPEMSLTGSCDPRAPGSGLPLEAPGVLALARATARHGVAALFGLAERSPGGVHITQVFARGGAVAGHYRKRHLGEDEDHFVPGGAPALFGLDGVPFGGAICAEGGADYPFDEPAAAGAPVVFLCAAPGRYGRRTDEASWRRGWEWWLGHGLRQAVRHASRLGIWVAVATQSGATVDEDFPGLAALVDPSGTVVATTPDWREGALVVEIPVERGRGRTP